MENTNAAAFRLLKSEIEAKASRDLGIRKELSEWSLQDIRDFQVDLEQRSKSSVSEKWIYTHFKNEHPRIPRIDVLNLLSAWLGYRNWDDFLHQRAEATLATSASSQRSRRVNLKFVIAVLSLVGLVLLGVAWFLIPKVEEHQVYFMDAYTRKVLTSSAIHVRVNRRPVPFDSLLVVQVGDSIEVDGAYYKPRTAVIDVNDVSPRYLEVFPDDYALMLSFFSRSDASNLDQRRAQLLEVIHPEARIFESHPAFDGLELLNREEFIDRLLLPLNSLKNLEVQHIEYRDEQIYRLQFYQNPDA
jgi:hypothetical protein